MSCNASSGVVTPAGAALLEPGLALRCSALLTVTTADIEAGPMQLGVSAAGASVLGPLEPVNKQVQLLAQPQPQLSITILEEGCTKPTKAGVFAEGAADPMIMHVV